MKVSSGILLAVVLFSARAWSVESVPFYGWQCKGQVKPGSVVYANVFYRGKINHQDLYRLEVTEVTGIEDFIFYQLAATDQAQASQSDGGMLYQGSSAQVLTTLNIPVSEERPTSSRSHLKISRVGRSADARLSELPPSDPPEYLLDCSPTRSGEMSTDFGWSGRDVPSARSP